MLTATLRGRTADRGLPVKAFGNTPFNALNIAPESAFAPQGAWARQNVDTGLRNDGVNGAPLTLRPSRALQRGAKRAPKEPCTESGAGFRNAWQLSAAGQRQDH